MATEQNTRLARNFHRTFKPERSYLSALLRYAAAGKGGTLMDISRHTGIPTGASSGKVQPTIDYCTGMGLLQPQKANNTYSFLLTPFGRTVLNEDPFLSEPVTQWLAHLQLCHPRKGADLWFQIFVEGSDTLSMDFSRQALEEHLRTVYAVEGRNPIGPVIGTYTDEAALKGAGVLTETGDQVHRAIAPRSIESRRGYAAWLAQLLADFFPEARNVPITEWERACGWKRTTGWHPSIAADMLADAEHLGVLTVDRHMQPWLIDLRIPPDEVWLTIFDDML
mgnify:FL=1